MKIKGTHSACGREFLLQQVLDSQGHCPWDGLPFNKDYTGPLALALRDAEVAGTALVGALEAIADMHPSFVLDEETIIGPIRDRLERLKQAAAPAKAGA